MEEKTVARKTIKTSEDIAKYMAYHYLELDNAVKTGEKKIAWCTSAGPAEILRAMGFLVYFPENHSVLLGTTRMATDFIPHAVALGFSPEICSYTTSDIGAFVKNTTPFTKFLKEITCVPKPDILVFNTNQCRDVQDWFGWYSRRLNVPILGINEFTGVKNVTEAHITAIAEQMEALIEPLEKISGRKFDIDELREILALSQECSDIWKEVLETATARPSPLTFFDGCTLMGPAVVGRGTQAAIDIYKKLLDEMKGRVKNK
jgi:benzoyl-CoA reductase/2-hydroxyglutaryl-CoA dehydratase subunit BcrC/BadD/HgdB